MSGATRFAYEALSADGARRRGVINAANARDAHDRLTDGGMTPVRIFMRANAHGAAGALSTRDASVFASTLARLLGAGIPLLQALGIMQRITRSRREAALCLHVARQIEQGVALSAALGAYDCPALSQIAAIARVGEASGSLSEALGDVAQSLREAAALQKKLVSLLIYPAIVALLTLVILFVFLVVVAPTLRPIFAEFEGHLPLGAAILFATSDAVRTWGTPALAIAAALALYLWSTPPGLSTRRRIAQALALSPIGLGAPVHSLYAGLARSLALCLRRGVALPAAFEIATDSMWSDSIKTNLKRKRQAIESGQQVSEVLRAAPHAPDLLIHLTAAGEASGRLAVALGEASDMLAEEARTRAERLVAIAGPAITVLLGGLVGGFVFTLFQALASIAGTVS